MRRNMAVYIEIRKERATENGFIYRYMASDGSIGRIEVNASNGASTPVDFASGDPEGRLYAMVAYKLLKHSQEGAFPDETCWAS